MGVRLLLEAVEDGEYDPECARLETAFRAIWLLYRRDKWALLAEMGLPRDPFLPAFERFDARYPVGKYLRTDRSALEFLRDLYHQDPHLGLGVLAAAIWLVGHYMTRRRRIMAAWYGWPEEEGDLT